MSNLRAKPDSKFHFIEEDGNSMHVFSLEFMSDGSNDCNPQFYNNKETPANATENTQESELSRILNDNPEETTRSNDNTESKETTKSRSDLLEYVMRDNGSVICKWCGEILQSRTHWYRHKYKVHVVQPTNPAPLFQCDQCQVFFKSRKGYIGHLASRHSDMLSDCSPVVSNMQTPIKVESKEMTTQTIEENKDEYDPEMSIPKTSVPNTKYQAPVDKKPVPAKTTDTKKLPRACKPADTSVEVKPAELEAKRTKEEKFVFDIINRVKRECEAQGSGNPTRKGYSRRQNAMRSMRT